MIMEVVKQIVPLHHAHICHMAHVSYEITDIINRLMPVVTSGAGATSIDAGHSHLNRRDARAPCAHAVPAHAGSTRQLGGLRGGAS